MYAAVRPQVPYGRGGMFGVGGRQGAVGGEGTQGVQCYAARWRRRAAWLTLVRIQAFALIGEARQRGVLVDSQMYVRRWRRCALVRLSYSCTQP